jgi:hypothetical protein
MAEAVVFVKLHGPAVVDQASAQRRWPAGSPTTT